MELAIYAKLGGKLTPNGTRFSTDLMTNQPIELQAYGV